MMLRLFAFVAALFPFTAAAHEVYVLTPEEISAAMSAPTLDFFLVIAEHFHQFLFWGLVTIIVVSTVFAISISRKLEEICIPLITRAKHIAPYLVRVGLGASVMLGALNGALLGPELPLLPIFGEANAIAASAFLLAGALIILNQYAIVAAAIVLIGLGALALSHGYYLLTYVDFFGALAFVVLDDSSPKVLRHYPPALSRFIHRYAPYRWAILRVAFGFSVMFASLYAKFLHNSLALAVVERYDLTSLAIFSAFTPEFLVLGAGIIELLAGLMLIVGFEVRHTSLFLAFWLTLSLLYFQEAVWPHAILFGLGGAFLLYGYDKHSLEGYFFKKGKREPVL